MKYFKMKESYSLQRWYEPDGIFSLVERHEDRYMSYFGTDCTWRNMITGKICSNWDRVMEELSEQENREFQISRIVG